MQQQGVAARGDVTCPAHAVQFYEDDDYLCRVVADYVSHGLAARQPAVVFATEPHIRTLTRRLALRGYDLEALRRTNDLTVLDAQEALADFMEGGMPEPDLFHSHVGHIIDKVHRRNPACTIRVFGDMVNLLWQTGNVEGTLKVEEFWNDLAARYRLSMLCGYSLANFAKEEHGPRLHEVCSRHTHVIPTERYMEVTGEARRLREVAQLQQRARALEAELEHRKTLEHALRLALEDRERAEAAREMLLMREQAARAEAESANRLKDEFLAVLSHELRTPLNAILGWSQIINSPHSDPPMVRRGLEVIRRNAGSQLHVIEDLLDVSHIVAGKLIVRTEVVNLGDGVNGAADTVQPSTGAKSLDLKLKVDPMLRPVTGDNDRLQQVVWNLLSNAVKFTPPQGLIDVQVIQDAAHARIIVRDTGEGISPEFLPHVFDRFRQADPGSTRVHGGLGLGLTVARYLVEAHGGTIRAQSEGPGLGSTFTVTLPTRSDLQVVTPGPCGAPLLTGTRVLIVDSDPNSRELFEYMLTQLGAVVLAVVPDDAERALNAQPFDVMVSDIGMPGRRAFALIEMVRKHPDSAVRELHTIAVTSYTGTRFRGNALSAGFDDYVVKPVEPRHLAERVAALLRT